MTVAVEKLSFAPMPSAKSRKKKSKKNSSSSKRRINKKALKARRGRTIAQCVYMSVRAAGKSGLSFTRIAECMKKSGVEVSNFVLMKVMKKMKKQRVLKCKGKKEAWRLNKAKGCPKRMVMKKRGKNCRSGDRKFKNKMRRNARLVARGNRTMEQCCNDLLKSHEGSMTMNQMLAYLNGHGIVVSKFVLKHVLQRLRAKKVFKIYQGYYSRTGKRLTRKLSKAANKRHA